MCPVMHWWMWHKQRTSCFAGLGPDEGVAACSGRSAAAKVDAPPVPELDEGPAARGEPPGPAAAKTISTSSEFELSEGQAACSGRPAVAKAACASPAVELGEETSLLKLDACCESSLKFPSDSLIK